MLGAAQAKATDAVNVVFHILNYEQTPATRQAYDSFFARLGKDPDLGAMTVSGYMCERVKRCM